MRHFPSLYSTICSAAAFGGLFATNVLAQQLLPAGTSRAVHNRAVISSPSTPGGSSATGRTINLQFPAGTRPESVKANLNGKSVGKRFTVQSCPDHVCLAAALSTADGIVDGENVLYATAKNEDGTASSSRFHFQGTVSSPPSLSARAMVAASPRVSGVGGSQLPTLNSFLPPTIAFSTFSEDNQGGGVNPGENWIQIGSQLTLTAPSCNSSSPYAVISLDRHTLAAGTSACAANGTDLRTQLSQIPSGQLVIVGTYWEHNTDTGAGPGAFDTTPIGGTVYNCPTAQSATNCAGVVSSTDLPLGYLAIGVAGAKSGSAYESYFVSADQNPQYHYPSASGMLAADVNGNYNFQPTSNVEYTVAPGANAATTQVTIYNAPSAPTYHVIYQPRSTAQNGFWLLVLDRVNLSSIPSCSGTPDPTTPGVYNVPNCGTFFPTGASGDNTIIQNLATALSSLDNTQLAILTTVGHAGWGNAQNMACEPGTNTDPACDNNTEKLGAALTALGIPDKSFLSTSTDNPSYATSAYTVVTAPGLGNPISGHSVLSNTGYLNHGHTGYVHGTLARDSFGRYEPAQTEQQTAGSDTANFKLGLVMAQAPVEWPELSTALPNASSLSGQQAAYQYLSWYLLNGWYVPGQAGSQGVTGSFQYDIHYFYTGSLNTSISIHTFDPLDAVYPGVPNFSDRRSHACQTASPSCTWLSTNGDGMQLQFTQNDFVAVQQQLHNEIVDLTNVLGYFVTDSTNLKDVVAAGNANAALTILQASSLIQANIIAANKPINPSGHVTLSPWHIVHMIASDLSPAISLATDGIVNPADIALADKAIGIIGDVFTASGSTSGGLASGRDQQGNDIPRLDYKLDTTIGELAGEDLQGQILAGFDTTLDAITSDWNRLQLLGSASVENQVLFAPTQVTQNQAIGMITKASQKSLYLSLIPQFYQVHWWPAAFFNNSTKLPDLGHGTGSNNDCKALYTDTQNPLTSIAYNTYGGQAYPPANPGTTPYKIESTDTGDPYFDWYILATPFPRAVTNDTTAAVMDTNISLVLFGAQPGGLNFSLDEFVAMAGPMDRPITGDPSQFQNAVQPATYGYPNFTGWDLNSICSVSLDGPQAGASGPPTQAPPASPIATITTLSAPASAVLGTDLVLQAHVVKRIGSAVPTGSVQFRDGATVMQTVPLDTTGSASFNANGLAVGTHTLSAYFVASGKYLPSNSDAQTVAIYADSPNIELSLSQTSINLSYGTTSSPVTLQVKALSGMSGTVTYSCTGLPTGLSCAFTPASGSFSNGLTTTSFTISGSAPTTAGLSMGGLCGGLFFAFSVVLLQMARRNGTKLLVGLTPLLLLTLASIATVGCGGSPKSPATVKDTGQKTVLVNATSGALTRTAPLTVTVQ